MATEDQHPHVVKPDLSDTNPVESVDLRSKSLPPQNFLLLAVDEGVTQRSCSANGASPYDKDAEAAYSNNTITNRPREKKTAFENSNSSDESRPYENGAGRSGWMADVPQDTNKQAHPTHLQQPKDGNETRGDDEVFSPKPFIKKGKIEVEMQQEDRTDKNDAIAPAEDPQNDGNVFVKGENVSRLLKDGYKVTTSQTTGRSNKELKATSAWDIKEPGSRHTIEDITEDKPYKGDLGKMNDESMTQTRATDDVASTSSHQHPKSQSNLHVQTTERKTKNNGAYDSNREASEDLNHEAGDGKCDTMQPLNLWPSELSEISRPRRASKAAILQAPVPSPSGETGFSRSTIPNSVAKPELPQQRKFSQETASRLKTPSSLENSNTTDSRRRSRGRRRSSVAAAFVAEKPDGQGTRNGSVQQASKTLSFGTLASSLVRWKMSRLRAAKKIQESIAKDAKHQDFMDRTADRTKTDLPRPLLVSIQEEAYPILLRTAQAYRSQLGAKHKLTSQAYDRLSDLIRDLNSQY